MTDLKDEHGVRIRPMRTADGEALAALHREAIMRTDPKFYSERQRKSWADGLTADGYALSVEDGEIIEVAVNAEDTPIAFCGRRTFGVAGLYVHPDWQGKGIGSLLLRRAEKALQKEGVLSLRVDASLPTVEFYERHQYRFAEERSHKTRGGAEIGISRMTKAIDKP